MTEDIPDSVDQALEETVRRKVYFQKYFGIIIEINHNENELVLYRVAGTGELFLNVFELRFHNYSVNKSVTKVERLWFYGVSSSLSITIGTCKG